MTYSEICKKLKQAGIENAGWEAQLLSEHFACTGKQGVVRLPETDLSCTELLHAVERRCNREPLQYILGEWDFYRQTYEVTPDCLIPRADTEVLVEEAIRLLPQGAFFADLCTGSGCIAISTLAERADLHALAVDLSEKALSVACRNACRNRVESRFEGICADVLDFPEDLKKIYPQPDAILSNPPYICTDVLKTLQPEVLREPEMALDGGTDGMIFYRALLNLAGGWLRENGVCLFEIGYDQGDAIRELALQAGFSCRIRKDYGGCDRVAILHRISETA